MSAWNGAPDGFVSLTWLSNNGRCNRGRCSGGDVYLVVDKRQVFSVRLSESVATAAGLAQGDRVELLFNRDGRSFILRPHQDGYVVSRNSPHGKAVTLRMKWRETFGLPADLRAYADAVVNGGVVTFALPAERAGEKAGA